MNDNTISLFGFPVIVTDRVTEGEILFGPLPTWRDVLDYGSLEATIEARKAEWAKIKIAETEHDE